MAVIKSYCCPRGYEYTIHPTHIRLQRCQTNINSEKRVIGLALIELCNIEKIYRAGEIEVRALDKISLQVERGEFVAIIGQSGSGKSTLMNILGCLDVPDGGDYRLDGEDVFRLPDRALSGIRNRKIGFVFQGFNLISTLDARENVELPLIYRGLPREQRRRMACDALELVGLGGRMHHLPGQLSGGQQQRVAIARAIAARPSILLADEPTGNLDTKAGAEIMEILRRLNAQGNTIVLITHDPAIAAGLPRRVTLGDGTLLGDSGQ